MVEPTSAEAELAAESAASRLRHADAVFHERDVRPTPLRRRVLAVLVEAEHPLGAYELAERVSAGTRKVAPISVYRTLDVLMDLGLVQRVALRNAFIARDLERRPGEADVFLICWRCHRIDQATSSDVKRELDRALRPMRFKLLDRALELEGECAECQGAMLKDKKSGHNPR